MENEKYLIYQMNKIDEIKFDRNYGMFVAAVNIRDERTTASIDKILRAGCSISELYILDFTDESDHLKKFLENRYSNKVEKISILNKDNTRRENLILGLKDIVDNYREQGNNIGIDITSIPTPHFFIVNKILAKHDFNVYFYYTEPLKYLLNNQLYRSYESMPGPISTQEINGFSGVTSINGNTKRVLICILGFDRDILPRVIDDSVPDKIVAINGFPSFIPKYKDYSLTNNIEVLRGNNAEKLEKGENTYSYLYYVDTRNPFETYNLMSKLYKKYDKSCLDVVPLGTKPTALGICKYALDNTNIRVLFPFPQKYNLTFSEGAMDTWEYKFD